MSHLLPQVPRGRIARFKKAVGVKTARTRWRAGGAGWQRSGTEVCWGGGVAGGPGKSTRDPIMVWGQHGRAATMRRNTRKVIEGTPAL